MTPPKLKGGCGKLEEGEITPTPFELVGSLFLPKWGVVKLIMAQLAVWQHLSRALWIFPERF